MTKKTPIHRLIIQHSEYHTWSLVRVFIYLVSCTAHAALCRKPTHPCRNPANTTITHTQTRDKKNKIDRYATLKNKMASRTNQKETTNIARVVSTQKVTLARHKEGGRSPLIVTVAIYTHAILTIKKTQKHAFSHGDLVIAPSPQGCCSGPETRNTNDQEKRKKITEKNEEPRKESRETRATRRGTNVRHTRENAIMLQGTNPWYKKTPTCTHAYVLQQPGQWNQKGASNCIVKMLCS